MEFNKVTGKNKGNKPSITFRKLPDTGNEPRYQAGINKNGLALMSKVFKGDGFDVLFSDSHAMIGFRRVKHRKLRPWFGATELINCLNLITYKRYSLVACPDDKDILIIDSDEFSS